MNVVLAHAAPPVNLGMTEWGFVALASVIIFAILGKKLWREFRNLS